MSTYPIKRLELAAQGKTFAQGGLNIADIQQLLGINDIDRDVLREKIGIYIKQKKQNQQKIEKQKLEPRAKHVYERIGVGWYRCKICGDINVDKQ